MADKRVPTQFIDLKTTDFGPQKQEVLGSRVQKVGKPPPTEFIQIPEHVREPGDVILELESRRARLLERSRRLAKNAVSICISTWDSTKRAVMRSISDATQRKELTAGRVITLQHDEELRLRPDLAAPFTMRMAAGATIVIYPEIDAPEGWIAARAPGGELGWVSIERLA